MRMFKRWYDTDTAVSKAINDLEKKSESIQEKCADYIMELLEDVELEQMSWNDQYNYVMRRWYDKNVKVSHAIEYLRLTPKDLRREVALKVLDFLEKVS